jgi:hypothetical protein
MDFAKLKANGDAALAQISNALDDLQYSPDQRPVPILHLAMDYVRDMLAILATASEQAPVAYIDPGTLENLVTLGETHVYSPEFRRVRDVPLFSSPAHTSEARDADFWALERGCAALLGGATWAAMHPEDKREYRDRLNAAMRQEAGDA